MHQLDSLQAFRGSCHHRYQQPRSRIHPGIKFLSKSSIHHWSTKFFVCRIDVRYTRRWFRREISDRKSDAMRNECDAAKRSGSKQRKGKRKRAKMKEEKKKVWCFNFCFLQLHVERTVDVLNDICSKEAFVYSLMASGLRTSQRKRCRAVEISNCTNYIVPLPAFPLPSGITGHVGENRESAIWTRPQNPATLSNFFFRK